MNVYKIFVSTKYYVLRILFEQFMRIVKTSKLPRHLAIITDGHRTYAKKHGISGKAAYVNGQVIAAHKISEFQMPQHQKKKKMKKISFQNEANFTPN